MFLLNRERSNDELGKVGKTDEAEEEAMASFSCIFRPFGGLVFAVISFH